MQLAAETPPLARECLQVDSVATHVVVHRVKVLDFGLAKPGSPEGLRYEDGVAQGFSPASSPTILQATGMGVILGTATYMAPEQARGNRELQLADLRRVADGRGAGGLQGTPIAVDGIMYVTAPNGR